MEIGESFEGFTISLDGLSLEESSMKDLDKYLDDIEELCQKPVSSIRFSDGSCIEVGVLNNEDEFINLEDLRKLVWGR